MAHDALIEKFDTLETERESYTDNEGFYASSSHGQIMRSGTSKKISAVLNKKIPCPLT